MATDAMHRREWQARALEAEAKISNLRAWARELEEVRASEDRGITKETAFSANKMGRAIRQKLGTS